MVTAPAEVKRLPKPSVPLWTVNQLARYDAAGVRRFVDLARPVYGQSITAQDS